MSMIVDDLDIERIATLEAEAHAPWVVEAHAALAGTVAVHLLQPVVGRSTHVFHARGQVRLFEFAQRRRLAWRPAPHSASLQEGFRVGIAEAPDHCAIVTLRVINGKRGWMRYCTTLAFSITIGVFGTSPWNGPCGPVSTALILSTTSMPEITLPNTA